MMNYVICNEFIELPSNLYKKFASKAVMSIYYLNDIEFIPYRRDNFQIYLFEAPRAASINHEMHEDHCPRGIKMEERMPSKPSGQYGSSVRLGPRLFAS